MCWLTRVDREKSLLNEFVVVVVSIHIHFIQHSARLYSTHVNPLIATLKPHSNGPSHSNTVIGTLAVEGRAVTFGTRRALGGLQCNRPPTNRQSTNFVLFDVALWLPLESKGLTPLICMWIYTEMKKCKVQKIAAIRKSQPAEDWDGLYVKILKTMLTGSSTVYWWRQMQLDEANIWGILGGMVKNVGLSQQHAQVLNKWKRKIQQTATACSSG